MVIGRRSWLAMLGLALLGACYTPDGVGNLVPPTADEDPRLPQVRLTVAGHTRAVHLETWGDPASPVLFLLHGAPGDFRAFLPLRALADRYFVVAWDQRGSGLSERISADEYTWDSVVEEIAVLKARYAPTRPISLLGHSFGGMYAALYASRRMADVDQLVLLEPGGLNGSIFADSYDATVNVDLLDPGMTQMFWQSETLRADTHRLADYRLLAMLQNGHQVNEYCDPDRPPPAVLWRAGAHVEYLRGVRMGAPHFAFDFAVGLDRFPREVLFVAGTCGALGADFQRRSQVPLFAAARLVALPNVGHRMLVEAPEAVLVALRGYLRAYVSSP